MVVIPQMHLLPRTNIVVLRWTLVALAAFCVLVAVGYFTNVSKDNYFFYIPWAIFWLGLTVGIWLLNPMARVVTKFCLWLIVIIIPLGTANPFAAINDFGPNSPSASELVLFWIAPWVVPAMFFIHVLGKYRAEFKWPHESKG